MFHDHAFRRRRIRLLPGFNPFDYPSPLLLPVDDDDFPTLIDGRWLRRELPTAFSDLEVEPCS